MCGGGEFNSSRSNEREKIWNFLLCLEKIFPISLNETIYVKEKLVKIVKQKINQFHG